MENAMQNGMITKEKKPNRIKLYGVIVGIVMLIVQQLVYFSANLIAKKVGITPWLPKIDAIDNLFTVVPVFVLPYAWSYAYWAMAPMAVSKCDIKHFYNYLAAYILATILGALVLIFAPTYMDRVAEGLTTRTGSGFFEWGLQFFYGADGGDMAYNLFPSFHCLVSTISYLGVMGRKEIRLWYRIYSLVMTILVYLATLFVKQHYFLDIIGGAGIAVIAYVLCVKLNAGRIFSALVAKCKAHKEKRKNKEK